MAQKRCQSADESTHLPKLRWISWHRLIAIGVTGGRLVVSSRVIRQKVRARSRENESNLTRAPRFPWKRVVLLINSRRSGWLASTAPAAWHQVQQDFLVQIALLCCVFLTALLFSERKTRDIYQSAQIRLWQWQKEQHKKYENSQCVIKSSRRHFGDCVDDIHYQQNLCR